MKTKNASTFILLSILFIIFVLLIVLVGCNAQILKDIDDFFFEIIQSNSSDFLTIFAYYFSYLATPIFVAIVMAILLILPTRKKVGVFTTFTTSLSAIIGYSIKYIICRARPVGKLVQSTFIPLSLPTTPSFPSGHAILSLAIGLSIYICLKNEYGIKKRYIMPPVLFTMLMGYCRIYLGVHFFSDILFGWCVSLIVILSTKLIYNYAKNNREQKRKLEIKNENNLL